MRTVERIAASVAANRETQHLLTCLDPLPQFIIDNAELRHLGDLPLLAGIGTGDTLACAGVLDVAAAVPLEPPNVKGVVEKARAAFGLAADRSVAPRAAAGAMNAFGVEPLGDRARAVPVRKSAPTGVDRILRTILALGYVSFAQIRQSDASGLDDAEVQALQSSQDPHELLSSKIDSGKCGSVRALATGHDRYVCLMGAV